MKLRFGNGTAPSGAPHDDYFHPAVAVLGDGRWLLTRQRLLDGSDRYDTPEVLWSTDGGQTWSAPQEMGELRVQRLANGQAVGVCDVRPFASPDGGKVVVIGCDSVYSNGTSYSYDKQSKPMPADLRCGATYTVYDASRGVFGPRRRLRPPELPASEFWRVACAQVAFTSEGDWIVPAYCSTGELVDFFGYPSPRCAVQTMKARLEGDELVPVAWGGLLRHDVQRGFVEPSVVRHGGKYLLTIRAEDGRAYVSVSEDGLAWQPPREWRFDDGAPLETDTTQQHWAVVAGRLFLAYTRKNEWNAKLYRFRSPMYIAEVALAGETPALMRASEQVLFPRRLRGEEDGQVGNFHVCSLPDGSAIASDAYLYAHRPDGSEGIWTESTIVRVRGE